MEGDDPGLQAVRMTQRNSSMDRRSWVFACIVMALLGCLCLLSLTGVGASVLYTYLHARSNPTAAPTPGYITPGIPRPTRTPGPTLPADKTGAADLPADLDIPIGDRPPPEAFQSLEALGAAVLPAGDLLEQAERLKGAHDVPRILADTAAPVPLGTVADFRIVNMDDDTQLTASAELRYITPHVYFWVEEGVAAADDDIRELVDRFENTTYPTDRSMFGSEWTPGVDGDPHLYMLYARNLGSSVGGYYSSTDEVSRAIHLYSNQHEMFYINADTSPLGWDFTGGILAHEFQHMIRWHENPGKETWLNEGFSELAVLLNGFDLGGFDRMYLFRTDIQMNFWPDITDYEAMYHYGGAFLYVDYFYSRFGEDAAQAFIENPLPGMTSVDDTLSALDATEPGGSRILDADDLMADFAAALLLDDPAVAEGQYQFGNYSVRRKPTFAAEIGDCPTGAREGEVSQYGIDYIRIACAGEWRLFFAGQTVQRVLPVDPAEGRFAAWSNRGEQSDTTLTRAFDLPAGSSATLQYRLWYDLEEKYDYAYLEASVDGGETWEILDTPSGTGFNPQGNNFRWGWSGMSGGGSEAAWIDEEVDLTSYAGKTVLVRFEYVTDPAQTREGLLVDDIRIPEIQYAFGFEDGMGGWEAEGFVRLENIVPQTYRVRIIRRGEQTTVDELALDERMFGEAVLQLADGEDAVLVVIATNRYTRQSAEYQFQILE
jgi:immune inhibitor A